MEVIDEKHSTAKIDYEQEQHIQTPLVINEKKLIKNYFACSKLYFLFPLCNFKGCDIIRVRVLVVWAFKIFSPLAKILLFFTAVVEQNNQ